MLAEWFYYLWVLLLLVACCACWFGTLMTLPGNWGVLTLAALFAWVVPHGPNAGISWVTLIVLGILALVGEGVEAFAGAAGAARQGGSRRGMLLSLIGTFVGSILGLVLGLPIPVVGSAIAAVLGGAMGAFVGAVLGEHWKGRPLDHQMEVGRAALIARLWGTAGKLAVGIVMIVLVTADALF